MSVTTIEVNYTGYLTNEELDMLWKRLTKGVINIKKEEKNIMSVPAITADDISFEINEDVDIFSDVDIEDDMDDALIDDMIESIEDQMMDQNRVFYSENAEQKYLVMNDLHIPFHKKRAVDAIIERYANRGYILILNGDILDCHDISTFPKAYQVGLDKEVKIFKKYLVDWSNKFDKIYLVSGNHEKRLATYLRKRLTPDVVQFMPDDIIESIVKDLALENLIYTPGEAFQWYLQIDNVILAHPKTFVQSILGTCTKVMEYFKARGSDANVYITAHTHKMGIAVQNGCVLLESGCLCLPQDYALEGQVSYKPQATGYVTFTSRNNKVSFNDIKLVNIG